MGAKLMQVVISVLRRNLRRHRKECEAKKDLTNSSWKHHGDCECRYLCSVWLLTIMPVSVFCCILSCCPCSCPGSRTNRFRVYACSCPLECGWCCWMQDEEQKKMEVCRPEISTIDWPIRSRQIIDRQLWFNFEAWCKKHVFFFLSQLEYPDEKQKKRRGSACLCGYSGAVGPWAVFCFIGRVTCSFFFCRFGHKVSLSGASVVSRKVIVWVVDVHNISIVELWYS